MATITYHALFNNLIFRGKFKEGEKFRLLIMKDNIKSSNVADKLGLEQREAKDFFNKKTNWMYSDYPKENYFYTISYSEWLEKNYNACLVKSAD